MAAACKAFSPMNHGKKSDWQPHCTLPTSCVSICVICTNQTTSFPLTLVQSVSEVISCQPNSDGVFFSGSSCLERRHIFRSQRAVSDARGTLIQTSSRPVALRSPSSPESLGGLRRRVLSTASAEGETWRWRRRRFFSLFPFT